MAKIWSDPTPPGVGKQWYGIHPNGKFWTRGNSLSGPLLSGVDPDRRIEGIAEYKLFHTPKGRWADIFYPILTRAVLKGKIFNFRTVLLVSPLSGYFLILGPPVGRPDPPSARQVGGGPPICPAHWKNVLGIVKEMGPRGSRKFGWVGTPSHPPGALQRSLPPVLVTPSHSDRNFFAPFELPL